MIQEIQPKIVVYFYENQPWEKSINSICDSYNIPTIAINHSMVSSDMFYLYNGKDIENNFCPTYLIANGKVELEVLKNMNKGKNTKLRLIGSKRHIYPEMKPKNRNKKNLKNIAIILDSTKENFLDIIKMLNKYAKFLDGYNFYFKSPPSIKSNNIGVITREIRFNYKFYEGELYGLFKKCEVVIYTSTTVGIEAYIENKICLRFIPTYTYSIDFTETIKDNIYTINIDNFLNVIKGMDYNKNNSYIDVSNYFKIWDKSKFNKIIKEILTI
jgi:hypothetical protein